MGIRDNYDSILNNYSLNFTTSLYNKCVLMDANCLLSFLSCKANNKIKC